MKSKTYRYGNVTCKAVLCAAGKGWETVFYFNHKPVFVGNFVHSKEALRWWGFMNREISKFGRKYTAGHKFPAAWVSNFLGNLLHKQYYIFLEKLFIGHHRAYQKAFVRDFRRFQTIRKDKSYKLEGKAPILKVA